jgi:hypothetical protein
MRMVSSVGRYVIARESNIVRVDFNRKPDPPAPRFPGGRGLRAEDDESETTSASFPTKVPNGKIQLSA